MTVRQWMLKKVYPLFMWMRKWGQKEAVLFNIEKVVSPVSFYSHSVYLTDGQPLHLSSLKGKKVMLVNTASDCGYTAQYAELQELYQKSNKEIVIIAFPSNEFKGQEPGADADIAQFCSRHYNVQFPLAQKTFVRNGSQQHPVYQWLTTPTLNGWNNRLPAWNFAKYLVDENGTLTHYFAPQVSPLHPDVWQALEV